MYGIDDQLREMREMSGNPHEDLLGGQPEFPAHLAPKQRELFMRIQQQQRQNVPEPPVNTQQEDKGMFLHSPKSLALDLGQRISLIYLEDLTTPYTRTH